MAHRLLARKDDKLLECLLGDNMRLAQLSDLTIGTLVRDRIYGSDTVFRLGIVLEIDQYINSVLVQWLVGKGDFNYYYPDNLEIICK